MSNTSLNANVNFIISVCFIGSFTLLAMVILFDATNMDNPIGDVLLGITANTASYEGL